MSTQTSELAIRIGAMTDVGGRENNEDSILVQDLPALTSSPGPGYLLAVADGMGGHENGEVASKLAIEYVQEMFARDQPSDPALALKQAYRRANTAIFQEAPDADRHPGTTLVTAVVRGKYVTIANVGDSRAYLMRANQITQVTQDHSVAAEQNRQGQLSEDEAQRSPQRNMLTQALGIREELDKRMPAIYELTLLPEDRLLLCTDGFYDVLTNDDYLHVLAGDDAESAANSLTSLAVERNTSDNVSAIVLAVGQSLASMQRQEKLDELAEQRGDRGQNLIVPAVIIIVIAALIAVGVIYFM